MIDRGILRVDEEGQIHLAPLANPYALKIDGNTDPEIAQEFQKLSVQLRELGKVLDSNGPSKKVEAEVAQISGRLEVLSQSLDIVPVEFYSQATNPENIHFYCDCCFLPLKWRNGPRIVVEPSMKQKLEDLSMLSDEELETLSALSEDELENLKSLNPVELRKVRDHFTHTGFSKSVHERGPGTSLAKYLRNYVYFLAADNGWSCELVDGSKKTEVHLRLHNKEKNKKLDLLLAPFGKLDPESNFKGVIVTSSEKSGMFKRLTIRGLTRAKLDVELTEEKLKKGNGDTLLIEDYVQLTASNGRDKTPRFIKPNIRFRDALIGLMNRDLEFVEGTHEIDDFTFRKSSRFALARRSDGNVLRKLINDNRYYADRRRIASDIVERFPGHTVEFDDRKEHKPRFGKGIVVFPTQNVRGGRSTIWSQSLDVKKIVINPYSDELYKQEKFVPEDWKNTLVIFHSRDKDTAAQQRRSFGEWMRAGIREANIARAKQGLLSITPESIGLEPFHSSVPSKVRGKIRGYLTQFEIVENMGRGGPFDDQSSTDANAMGYDLFAHGLGTETVESEVGERAPEPTPIGEIVEQVARGLERPTPQGPSRSIQRFLDHETGMDNL